MGEGDDGECRKTNVRGTLGTCARQRLKRQSLREPRARSERCPARDLVLIEPFGAGRGGHLGVVVSVLPIVRRRPRPCCDRFPEQGSRCAHEEGRVGAARHKRGLCEQTGAFGRSSTQRAADAPSP